MFSMLIASMSSTSVLREVSCPMRLLYTAALTSRLVGILETLPTSTLLLVTLCSTSTMPIWTVSGSSGKQKVCHTSQSHIANTFTQQMLTLQSLQHLRTATTSSVLTMSGRIPSTSFVISPTQTSPPTGTLSIAACLQVTRFGT